MEANEVTTNGFDSTAVVILNQTKSQVPRDHNYVPHIILRVEYYL